MHKQYLLDQKHIVMPPHWGRILCVSLTKDNTVLEKIIQQS